MLNDKAEINVSRKIYERYSLVDDYEDEYDDTYDSHNIGASAQDDSTEAALRPFTIPRVGLNSDLARCFFPIISSMHAHRNLNLYS